MATSLSTIDGDLLVRGLLRAANMVVPPGSVGDTGFNSGDPLTALKQQHQYPVRLVQVHGTAAVAERRAVHLAYAAGTIVAFTAGVTVACIGDSTITVDLRKNGTTVMSAPIVLDNTNTANASESGAVSVTSYAAGDVLEVVVTVSAGTGTLGQGLFTSAVLREAAA